MSLAISAALALVSGMMLGLRFKAYILLPISWATIVVIVVSSAILGLSFWKSVLVIVSYLTLLQSSYLVGANFSNLPSKARGEDAKPRTSVRRMAGEI